MKFFAGAEIPLIFISLYIKLTDNGCDQPGLGWRATSDGLELCRQADTLWKFSIGEEVGTFSGRKT
ncbi:MAG: hypothetical protein ABJH45_20540 [Paracoccaceae bacterium]|tara:strand:+ start:14455 stop:14652 length:198 start_codon:yes stop_codon:yes gene_type:complete